MKRTMSLARYLNDFCLTLFLIDPSDRWSRERLADQGLAFVCEPIDSVWSRLMEPKAILVDTRQKEGLDVFIQEAKKRHLPVASIHDHGLDPLPSDIVIDGSVVRESWNFPNPNAIFYTGPGYMILDPVYRLLHQRRKNIGAHIAKVFINLGGSDSISLFRNILNGLKLWNRDIEVLAVPGYSSWEHADISGRTWHPLDFKWIPEYVSTHCFQADLAITDGGTAAYEALCAGTPLMALSNDGCQQKSIRFLAGKDACIELGSRESFDSSRIPEILTRIEHDRMKRQSFSMNGRKIVDGGGLERVAQIIRDLVGPPPGVSLREGAG